jgi:hypothetical protein
MEGRVMSPPPYFDVASYDGTVALLRSLSPRFLLPNNYDVMEEAACFLEESAKFVERTQQVVSEVHTENRELSLRGRLEATNPTLGSFNVIENELAGTLRAHARELVAAGRAKEVSKSPAIGGERVSNREEGTSLGFG